MLDGIRQRQSYLYSFDDYQTMLALQCGVDLSAGADTASGGAAQQAADRNYSMYMIDLHGLEMDSEQSDVASK